MLHTSWVYQSKNSDKWLVLGYKTDVSYIKDYVPKQIDKMVEKYEDL